MKSTTFMPSLRKAALVLAGVAATAMTTGVAAAPTPLADQPISIADVPANVMLALSVEFPTAITRAHQEDFDTTKKYLGYFDSNKCYDYIGTAKDGYFKPAGFTGANYTCLDQWSGNFMNWATMQGIDTFRWVLTGGLRIVDEPKLFANASGTPLGTTILERAMASTQGDSDNFPDRSIPKSLVGSYTGLKDDFLENDLYIRNKSMGVLVQFGSGSVDNKAQLFHVGVEVCRDVGTGTDSLLESNCRKYVDSTGTKTVWKPTGLMQQHKDKMYFGARA